MGAKSLFANEGVVNLRGNGAGSCFAASVYVDGNYRIVMTCRDLRIALSAEKNRYVAWIEGEEGKQKRIGEVEKGKLSTISDMKFVKLFITSEEDSYGNKPSIDVMVSGIIEPIDFGKSVVAPAIISPTPTQEKEVNVTKTKVTATPKATVTSTSTSTSSTGLGSALSTIFKIGLFGFGLLLVIVGVFSFLQRRRSL